MIYELWALDGNNPPERTNTTYSDEYSAVKAAKRLLSQTKNVRFVEISAERQTCWRIGRGWISRRCAVGA
ncbi:MAG: hypothetical protein AB7M12_01895 [Hyphomonadaceae bacterium]